MAKQHQPHDDQINFTKKSWIRIAAIDIGDAV